MNHIKHIIYAVSLLGITFAPQANAQPIQSLIILEQQLEGFLGKKQGEAGGARRVIDRRLKLAACPELPVIERRSPALAIIRCEPLNWRISVPLKLVDNAANRYTSGRNVVDRGQPVLLVVRKNGFVVTRQMIAGKRGQVGDVIPVRTSRRSPPILAEIIGPGRVSVPSY